MPLSDLAAIGSFVSGAAVLVSLVFLYFQLGQVRKQIALAEKNQRAIMQQGRAARSAENIMGLGDSFKMGVWVKATQTQEPLSSTEAQTFLVLINAQLMNWEELVSPAQGRTSRCSVVRD